ncbi:MAG: YidC/Oxa1 family membrane protein insertase [Clostridia bacterium]|nr:YidC/Oxa1 family membrane protein insertase [Clostridia bacterium]
MFDAIANILAIFIRPIYSIVQNYGWTIIIFTILIKLVTIGFSIKSQKSMARMQQVQPLINEIQRKYANNREKMQQELTKVYDKYEISPTGGCMPMLLQLVILMGFIQIVYKPYTYLLNIPVDSIKTAAATVGADATAFLNNQLSMPSNVLSELVKMGYETELELDFLGLQLGEVLSQNMGDWKMWILPVLALLFTILSTYTAQLSANKNQNEKQKNDPQAQQAAAMSKSMYIMMPLMTAYITYTWPLGCALYWIISTVTQMIQQFLINELVVKKMKPIELKKKKKKPQVKREVIDIEAQDNSIDEGEKNE